MQLRLRNGTTLPEALRDIRLQLEVLALNARPGDRAATLQVAGLLLQAEGVARANPPALTAVPSEPARAS